MDKKITDLQKKLVKAFIPEEIFPPEVEKEIVDYVDFRKELTNESDRGCALLAASHLDYLLEQMLKSKLLGTEKHLQTLFDFNGPLGTFSSRILMSYSTGLISKTRMDDLQTIRKIRNDFGHSPSLISFESDRIRSLCNNLKMIRKSNNTSRAKFVTSVSFISGGIIAERFKNKKFELVDNIDIEGIKEIQKSIEIFENLFKKNE